MGTIDFQSTFLSDGPISPVIWGLFILLVIAAAAVAVAVLAVRGAFAYRYETRPVLNKSERHLHAVLTGAVAAIQPRGPRVLCQVCYGEFLRCHSQKGFWQVNAKRADFLIVDAEFRPLMVVEYQGEGHYGRGLVQKLDARKRDIIKQEACASAGLPWLEITSRYDAQAVREAIVDALSAATSVSQKEKMTHA